MKLPVYRKVINQFEFKQSGEWEIMKGHYDDGQNQFIVTFEPRTDISSFRKHYYRFPLFGAKETGRYYWLILNPFQNVRFTILQFGLFKALIIPFANAIRYLKSMLK